MTKTYQLAAASRALGASLQRANLKPGLGAYVVLSERGVVDQICGTEREARKEVKDLKAMGFDKASFKPFATWSDAEAYADKLGGY